MMALFGGIAHAPLAVMLMVAEMTGNLSMLAPAMIAVGLSTALVGDNTINRWWPTGTSVGSTQT
jgi:CIC family chloride channel protein